MIARALGILALLFLTVGLWAGTAGPGRAMAHVHHQHGVAVAAEEPCAGQPTPAAEAPCEGMPAGHHDGGVPAHEHGSAGCICAVGACDLSVLPGRLEAVTYTRLAGLPPAAERMPPALHHAPPLKPPRT